MFSILLKNICFLKIKKEVPFAEDELFSSDNQPLTIQKIYNVKMMEILVLLKKAYIRLITNFTQNSP